MFLHDPISCALPGEDGLSSCSKIPLKPPNRQQGVLPQPSTPRAPVAWHGSMLERTAWGALVEALGRYWDAVWHGQLSPAPVVLPHEGFVSHTAATGSVPVLYMRMLGAKCMQRS